MRPPISTLFGSGYSRVVPVAAQTRATPRTPYPADCGLPSRPRGRPDFFWFLTQGWFLKGYPSCCGRTRVHLRHVVVAATPVKVGLVQKTPVLNLGSPNRPESTEGDPRPFQMDREAMQDGDGDRNLSSSPVVAYASGVVTTREQSLAAHQNYYAQNRAALYRPGRERARSVPSKPTFSPVTNFRPGLDEKGLPQQESSSYTTTSSQTSVSMGGSPSLSYRNPIDPTLRPPGDHPASSGAPAASAPMDIVGDYRRPAAGSAANTINKWSHFPQR